MKKMMEQMMKSQNTSGIKVNNETDDTSVSANTTKKKVGRPSTKKTV